ncbi:ATP-binding protein [Shewanella sp. YIC-542]|uniref:ATP-binding protein n=1 Tax=Shewanella mytili TaxID=3377111 RepID=UPI00398F4B6B
MSAFFIPNRLFIKLLLGFWLCSSLIILAVGSLPLLQQNREAGAIPPHIMGTLQRTIKRLQRHPQRLQQLLATPEAELSTAPASGAALQPLPPVNAPMSPNGGNGWLNNKHRRSMDGQPFHLFLFDDHGRLLHSPQIPPIVRKNLLLISTSDHEQPRTFIFRDEMFFGPLSFNVAEQHYRLYGGIPGPHRVPWFFFFIEHKLLTLSLAILLSGILCALLAWHLGKPLRSLKYSAHALAHGDLSNRVDNATAKRHDEIGELAIAFNSMADAIENTVNSQQRLISDISHELRTPLTRLQLALALARKKGLAGEEAERIAYEADQLEKMIAELLALSRAKLKIQEDKVCMGLAESLSQVLDDAEFEAAQRHKNILIEIPEELELCHYPRSLSRAIENLLRNAIRYSHMDITISARQVKQQVLITITDDGPGIEEQELQAIFKPFYRPQSARDRESGGWGLGLAITQAAINAHHGTINASNRKAGGLEIMITLPIA